MKIHPSALKHGVEEEDAIQAAHWAQWIEPLEADDWPHRDLRLGFDAAGRLIETVVPTFESGNELVIHAMPARKQYWDLLPWETGSAAAGPQRPRRPRTRSGRASDVPRGRAGREPQLARMAM